MDVVVFCDCHPRQDNVRQSHKSKDVFVVVRKRERETTYCVLNSVSEQYEGRDGTSSSKLLNSVSKQVQSKGLGQLYLDDGITPNEFVNVLSRATIE